MIKLSVVIGTRNRDEHLKACIESLSHQTVSNQEYEIIIVNYGGSKDTGRLVKSFSLPNLKYIYVNETGIYNESRSKNIGIKNASGIYVLCTNADIIFSKNTIKHLISQFNKFKNPVIFTKKRYELPEGYQIIKNFNRLLDAQAVVDKGVVIGSHTAIGDFQAARKLDFISVNGYDERMIGWGGMDNDLAKRLSEIGVIQKWLSTENSPIFHQYHDYRARKHIKHNINLILAKTGYQYNPKKHEWGNRAKKFKIVVSSDASISESMKSKISQNLTKLNIVPIYGNFPDQIYKLQSFDGVIHIYQKTNNFVKIIKQVAEVVVDRKDIAIVKNQNFFPYFPIVGYNARSFLILSSRFKNTLNQKANFIIDKMCARYYFSSEKIPAQDSHINLSKYIKGTCKAITLWQFEKRKSVV